MSIRNQFAVLTVGLLAATLLVMAVAVYVWLEAQLYHDAERALYVRAFQVRTALSPTLTGATEGTAPSIPHLPLVEEFGAPGLYVQLSDENGHVIARSANLGGDALPDNSTLAGRAARSSPTIARVGDERLLVLALPLVVEGQLAGFIEVAESMHFVDDALRDVRTVLALAGALVLVLATAGSWLLSRRVAAPLVNISSAARSIRETRDFTLRVPGPASPLEVKDLAETVNALIDRVQETLSTQRQFLADSSHELRSPLTIIAGNLDLLEHDLDREAQQECLTEIRRETTRMRSLVQDLLFLSQADARRAISFRPVDLQALLDEVARAAVHLSRGQEIVLAQNDAATVAGDPDRLRQLLLNLVDNAIKYTPAGGTITLRSRRLGNVVEMSVADTGIGISAEHVPYIFGRFYRVDRGRSRSLGGTGLGLTIVQYIAQAHGGSVGVESVPGLGSTFSVRLPVASAR